MINKNDIKRGMKMKVLTVVGARPQFIKASVVSRVLRNDHTEVLVHTGQHYDYNMSGQFFDELDIPKPDYNLGVSGGTHSQMTGKMMMAIEEVLLKEKPDWVLLYGDTNSTLAAALPAAKLHIPICHVEAGGRTHCKSNPEEINRICTDHVSSLLLASTQSGMDELSREGLSEIGYLVGDPMYDAFLQYASVCEIQHLRLHSLDGFDVDVPMNFYYLTCHREENTANDNDLLQILNAMEKLDAPTIYPVHPRNTERVFRLRNRKNFSKIFFVEPVGYLESICLVNNAKKIVTDSGGLQREAFFAGKKCVTVLDFVAWPETMVDGRNTLARPVEGEILKKLAIPQTINESYRPFGDGHAGYKIVEMLERYQHLLRESGK